MKFLSFEPMKKVVAFLFLFVCSLAIAQIYTAKVIGVKDGDTVVILHQGKPQTIRLAHVDCPEKNQPFGNRAKQFVSDFCFGKEIQVVIAGKPDRNGRWIAEIFHQNQNLGKQLVRHGLAWHFKRYSNNTNYAALETEARKKKTGLWRDARPVAPWDWRKLPKAEKQRLRSKTAVH
ncbi:thermonuclease family protein [Chryseobacterium sp. MFBS3-17]|nr:thermonuclease family protein [Chryseobacterium sp. MFBS3-17]